MLVNQTCDAESGVKKVKSEFSSPLISGDSEEDIHVLQCVNNSGETGHREHRNAEQNVNRISASDPNNPMSSLLSLPLSKITATGPLNGASGNPPSDEIRRKTEFVPRIIGSDIPQGTTAQAYCAAAEDQRSPASFGANPAVNWEQHIRYTFAFQRNNLSGPLNFRDGSFGNVSGEEKVKSESAEEKIQSMESEAETSAGELIQETFAGEINRKRTRRAGEGYEPRKNALQRKMEHLGKEKERR